MKCPHCNADMTTVGFTAHGLPIFHWGKIGLDEHGLFVQEPVKWQLQCPGCGFSGPRQSSKQEAEDVIWRLCGQREEA